MESFNDEVEPSFIDSHSLVFYSETWITKKVKIKTEWAIKFYSACSARKKSLELAVKLKLKPTILSQSDSHIADNVALGEVVGTF